MLNNVTAQNSHRPLLESIRTDLYHFDEEKRERIIYNIENYVETVSPDDADFVEVLKRVLEVIKQFRATKEVLLSPAKHLSQKTGFPPSPSNVVRKLFADLEPFVQENL